jgi:hypothetical protein
MLLQPLNPHADSKGNDDGKMADADGHLRTVAIQDFFPMELLRLQRRTARASRASKASFQRGSIPGAVWTVKRLAQKSERSRAP